MNADYIAFGLLILVIGIFFWTITGAAEETRKNKGDKR